MSDMALDQPDPTNAAIAGAGMKPAPSAAPGAARSGPSPADELMKKVSESQQRSQGLLAAESREKGPVVDAAIAETRKPGPAAPTLERETAPPKSNMQQQMRDWLMPMVALSAIAGAFSRQHATTALNAFAAGVKGLKEGNLTLYEQKLKEWKTANESVLKNNKAALDEYNAVWNNKKFNIDQKMSEISLIASKYQDKLAYEASSQKNFTAVAQLLQKQEGLTDKLKYQYDALDAKTKETDAKLKLLRERQTEGTMDDATLDQMVDRRLAGDKSVTTNVGRGNQGAINISRFNEKLATKMREQNITGADLAKVDQQYTGGTAYQRSAGGQAARVESATNEVEALIPQAIETSRALPRSKFVPWNTLVQKWQAGTSDPAYNDFMIANFSLINAYARAMNPTGQPRITERMEAKAEGILSHATSQEAYQTQVNRLWQEVKASKGAVAKTREGIQPAGPSPIPPKDGAPPAPQAAPGGAAQLSDDELKAKLGIQ